MKRFLYLLPFLLMAPTAMNAQPTVQDCLGAIPVCLNTYNQYNGYTGIGTINDIPAGSCPTTCMSAGERNSVWYTFTVQSTGWFDLRITPWVMSDDYDWALFNMTTANCSDLQNTALLPILEVSCNWSADGGITGANTLSPNTGVTCWGSAPDANNPRVWVTAGQTYYLNISNYTGYGAGHGYQLNMTNSTASIFDNVRPYMLAVPTPVACGTTTITITMSENVLCSTVSAADFTLAGHTVTAVSGAACLAGATMENSYTLTISPALDPGVHTICINGSAGHISDLCGNLTDPANPNNCRNFTVSGVSTTLTASPNPICAGQTVTLTAGGGTSYSWSGGLGTGNPKTVTPASTTTYTVTGTNSGCTSSAAVTVTVNPGPTVSISAAPNPICAGSSTTLTASGATTYAWSGGLGAGNPKTVSPATTTTYTVTGTTAGCTGSASITITVNPAPTVTINASVNPICPGQSTSLTAGGASTYTWSGGLGAGNPKTVNPASTTTYTVTGTTSGCTNTATITVTVNPNITVTASATPNPTCAGASSTITASGGSTYSWSGGLGTGNPKVVNPASTTTYSVTGTSVAGCTGSTTVTVTVNPNPTVTASATPVTICQGASTSLSGLGATTYSWSGGLGAGSPVTASPASTTSYTVTGTTAGCTGTAAVTVTVNPVPTVTINASVNPICPGQSTSLTAGGATTYAWSGGLGAGNPKTVSPASTTTYTVTGTTSGCTNTATITVTVSPNATITASATPNPVCAGASTTITAAGGSTYAWSGGLGTGNPKVVNPASTTTYSVTGTSVAGCTGSTTVTVTVNPNPTVTASATAVSICLGASTSLSGGGATTYNWSGGLGAGSPVTASPASTTSYTVTGTTAGCTGTAAVTVTVNPVTANAGADMAQGACASSTNTLNGSGTGTAPLGYSWTPTSGLSNPAIANPVANPAVTTTYTLTVTNGAGCSASDAMIVTVNTLSANAGADGNIGACASSTFNLNGSATGTGPFSYSWTPSTGLSNPAIANPVANPASTTTYTLTVTDTYGCTASDAAIVNVAALPTANAGTDANIGGCVAAANANLNGSGTGSAPLSYAWTPTTGLSNPAIANPTADPAATTSYTLTVSDTYGCTATDAMIVTVAPLPTANAGADAIIGACTSAPSATLNGSGTGTAPLAYAWTPTTGLSNPAVANPTADPAATTTYTLTVSDTYGCTATDAAIVTVDPMPTASAGPDGTLGACGGTGYNITGSGTGTGPLTYSWTPTTSLSNPNIASPNAMPAATTTYTLTVTDAYGCTATDAVVVTTIPLPTANAGIDGNIGSCATSSYNIIGSGTGSAPLSYSWTPTTGLSNPGITNPVAQPASTQTYTLTVTDSYGCTATDAVVVNVFPLPTADAGVDGAIGSCAASSYTINGVATGTAPLTYAWLPTTGLSNPAIITPVAQPASTTNYTLTVTDPYGCTATDAMVLTVNPAPVVNAGADVSIGTCPASNAALNGSVIGSGPFTYIWTPSNGLSNPNIANPSAHPSATTTYTLTVTDTYGCTGSDALVVTVDPLPTADAGTGVTIGACPSSTTTLSGNGTGTGITFLWTPSTGLSNPNISNPVANPTTTTSYVLTVTDLYGCTATDNVTISVAPLPTISVNPANPTICDGNNVNLTASGASTYTWTPTVGLSGSTGISVTANPTISTTYTVTGLDIYGCSNSTSVTVNVNSIPVVSIVPNAPAICAGSSVVITAAGAAAYNWSPIGGLNTSTGSTVTASPGATITYTVTGTTAGCNGTNTVTVTVNPLPIVSISAMADICNNDPAFLLSSGSPAGGVYSGSGVTGSTFNPATAGAGTHTLTYTYTDINNCTSSASQNITVLMAPTVTVTPANPTICLGLSTSLNAVGAINYTWMPPNGLSTTIGTPVIASPGSTTTYIVTGEAYGCTNTASVTVDVLLNIPISVIPDNITICPGDFTVLTVVGAATYHWSPPTGLSDTLGSSVVANPQYPIIYTVTGIDAAGCTGLTTATVNVFPEVIMNFVPVPNTGCPPLNVDFIFYPSPLIDSTSWVWNFGDPSSGALNSSTMQQPSHVYVNPDYYLVTLSGNTTDGCAVSSTDTITVFDAPIADFMANPEVAITDNPLINFYDQSLGAYYWNWNFGDPNSEEFNTSTDQNTSHTYSYSGDYSVTLIIENLHGCADTAVKNVTIQDAFAFFIPNSFTPNEDGQNDFFLPKGVGFLEESFSMMIYDRWGKTIFKSTDINIGWDGTDQRTGKVQPEGVYTYIILVRDASNIQKKYLGSVTLVQ